MPRGLSAVPRARGTFNVIHAGDTSGEGEGRQWLDSAGPGTVRDTTAAAAAAGIHRITGTGTPVPGSRPISGQGGAGRGGASPLPYPLVDFPPPQLPPSASK